MPQLVLTGVYPPWEVVGLGGCSGPAQKTKFFPGCLYKGLFTLAFFAILGYGFQLMSSRRDAAAYPAPGKMVDIGGYRLHMMQSGDVGPTVILEAGLGDTSLVWSKIQDEIGQFTRVVSYDRAGMGWSDAGPEPRDSKQIAKELRLLLDTADIPGPYILVGHSMGGWHARVFAGTWPEDVAGMVLVDAAHEEQFEKFPPEITQMVRRQGLVFSVLSRLAPFGVVRLMGMVKGEELEEQWRGAAVAVANRTQVSRTLAGELRSMDINTYQVVAAGDLGDRPLVVLTVEQGKQPTYTPELNETMKTLWNQLQQDLTGLSTRSSQVVAEDGKHHIHLTRPDLVVDAVKQVVETVREESQPSEP